MNNIDDENIIDEIIQPYHPIPILKETCEKSINTDT